MRMSLTQSKVELSEEQKSVYQAVLARKNVLVTGSAGTGKSTLLSALLKKFPFDLAITASTGIAAVNVQGRTIHSWAGIDHTKATIPEVIAEAKNRIPATLRVKAAKMLAVDEISMVDASLMEAMDAVFRAVRGVNEPFGGIQMIFFGDFLQLPPVNRESKFAFESPVWKKAEIETFRLTKVFRQEDEAFSAVLNEVRLGNITPEVGAFLNQRRGLKPSGKIKPVVVHSHNKDVDDENEKMLKKLKGEVRVWKARDHGEPNALKAIQKNCLAPETLNLKVGAQVMCLWNIAPEEGVANGSIGIVKEIGEYPTVQFENGMTMEFKRQDYQMKEHGKVIAGRSQIPLRLAYSITAHKCQGMTLDAIEVFLDKCFAYGQAYVALSRCRTVDGLFISSMNPNKISADPRALEFYGHTLETA